MISRRLRGIAVAAACAVALSSCGSVHPGDAARVGDTTISDEQLSQSTRGFCDLIDVINQAQARGSVPVPVRSALLTALNTLVMGAALDHLAVQHGVGVTDAEVRSWIGRLPVQLNQVPDGRAGDLAMVTDRVARNALLVEKLGRMVYQRENPGQGSPGAAAADQIQRLGQQFASDYLSQVDVETNPRYGQVLDTQKLPGTGSLSVPVSAEGRAGRTVPDPASGLSQTEQCS
ncbi:MAG: hypothetical protein ACRDOY_09220 [Nocardioidaceae bacterium]